MRGSQRLGSKNPNNGGKFEYLAVARTSEVRAMRIWEFLALAACGDEGLPPAERLLPPIDFALTGAKIFTADEVRGGQRRW